MSVIVLVILGLGKRRLIEQICLSRLSFESGNVTFYPNRWPQNIPKFELSAIHNLVTWAEKDGSVFSGTYCTVGR